MMRKQNETPKQTKDDEDYVVEQTVASLNIEGMRVPDDEKEILKKIASGELDADEVADAIAKKAIAESASKNK